MKLLKKFQRLVSEPLLDDIYSKFQYYGGITQVRKLSLDMEDSHGHVFAAVRSDLDEKTSGSNFSI